jgi:hypothetical protein
VIRRVWAALLQGSGMGCLVVAGWLVHVVAGLVVAGVCLVVVGVEAEIGARRAS